MTNIFLATDPVTDLSLSVDTVWMLLAAMLVFFMQPGFALCEAGFTRSKNTANILFKNFVDFIFGSLLFWLVGFGFMFGNGGEGFVGLCSVPLRLLSCRERWQSARSSRCIVSIRYSSRCSSILYQDTGPGEAVGFAMAKTVPL